MEKSLELVDFETVDQTVQVHGNPSLPYSKGTDAQYLDRLRRCEYLRGP